MGNEKGMKDRTFERFALGETTDVGDGGVGQRFPAAAAAELRLVSTISASLFALSLPPTPIQGFHSTGRERSYKEAERERGPATETRPPYKARYTEKDL